MLRRVAPADHRYPFFPSDKAPFDRYPVTDSLSPAESLFPQAGGHTIRNLNNTDTFYVPDSTLALVGLREWLQCVDACITDPQTTLYVATNRIGDAV